MENSRGWSESNNLLSLHPKKATKRMEDFGAFLLLGKSAARLGDHGANANGDKQKEHKRSNGEGGCGLRYASGRHDVSRRGPTVARREIGAGPS